MTTLRITKTSIIEKGTTEKKMAVMQSTRILGSRASRIGFVCLLVMTLITITTFNVVSAQISTTGMNTNSTSMNPSSNRRALAAEYDEAFLWELIVFLQTATDGLDAELTAKFIAFLDEVSPIILE